jgi:NAD(P)-dependent dehydrogenase (short-subunit alcohol dehydrogenase family)
LNFAIEQFGRLDCLVNNAAAVGPVGSISETSEEAWDRTMAVTLKSVVLGMKHAARVMVPRRKGVIVSTASSAGLQGGLGPHVYTAAKHGVVGLTRSVASELAQWGIRVNAVAPGGTRTNMLAMGVLGSSSVDALNSSEQIVAAFTPLGRAGQPRDIAEAICYLASDAAAYITGQTLLVDGGQTMGKEGPQHMHNQTYAERI